MPNNNNIQVAVRCRPLKPGESQILSTDGLRGNTVTIDSTHSTSQQKAYTFDHVFGDQSDQAMLYADVGAPIVDEMLQGFNCTIFAYGMTGTGKTYTMSMDEKDTAALNPSDRSDISNGAGIIPRALHSIFNKLESQHAECSVRVSYIELYNEELRDLLSLNYKPPQTTSSTNSGDGLKMFGDPKGRGGVIIQGLEETLVNSAEMAFEAFERGSRRRRIASTNCNEYSSRSHSVFTITVHIKDYTDRGDEIVKVGKLNLVDLAGSENIGRSGAVDLRAREAGNINASLLALGRVINGLVERSDRNRNKKLSDKAADKSYIPYRDSKLTRLLQDSLGGETKTFIIATISPSKTSIEETLSTLDYALRAKSIENKPQVQQKTSKNTYINDLVAENVRVKAEFRASIEHNNGMWFSKEKVAQYDHLVDNKEKCEKDREGFVAAEKEHLHTLQKLDLADNEIIIKRNTIAKLEKQVEGLTREVDEERVVNGVREKGEQVNWSAAQKWLEHARDEHSDVDIMHGMLEKKQIEHVSDASTLSKYHSETAQVIRECSEKSTNHSRLIGEAMGEMDSRKRELATSLNSIPQLAESVMGESAHRLHDLIAHLATMEDESSVASQLSCDSIVNSGGRVSEMLATVVRKLEESSAEFATTLTQLLERELHGMDDRLDKLFYEYTQRSTAKVTAMEKDVDQLTRLCAHMEGHSVRVEGWLSEAQTRLQAYATTSEASSSERTRALVAEVTRAMRSYEEEEAGERHKHLEAVRDHMCSTQQDTAAHASHTLHTLERLTQSTRHHASSQNDECTHQSDVWASVRRATREMQQGVQAALRDNGASAGEMHRQMEQDGLLQAREIVERGEELRRQAKSAHENYSSLSQHTQSDARTVCEGVAQHVAQVHLRVQGDVDTLSSLTASAAGDSRAHADDVGRAVASLELSLDALMQTLSVGGSSNTNIPRKREWVGDGAYDMQAVQSRGDVLRAVTGGPPKRAKSFGGGAGGADGVEVGDGESSNAHNQPHAHPHSHADSDRQGSAPPEMSPRKEGAYTVDARVLKESKEEDAGEMFRKTLSSLKGDSGEVERVPEKVSAEESVDIEGVEGGEGVVDVELPHSYQPPQPPPSHSTNGRRAPQPSRRPTSNSNYTSTSASAQGNPRVTRNRAPLRTTSTNTTNNAPDVPGTARTRSSNSSNNAGNANSANGKAPPAKRRTVRHMQ
ncbi:hypothetical protein E3P92_02741 [Wallemia ichthyophaga]|nr:hypothetical protein E3P92_02741 [Wallemia ichthyophaga]